MTRLLLVGCVLGGCALGAFAPAFGESVGDPTQIPPSVHLIKPHSKATRADSVPHVGLMDERCKPLKLELESVLKQQGKARKAFQAQLAHNAGTRLCREGHTEKGMAEFRKGLSYLN